MNSIRHYNTVLNNIESLYRSGKNSDITLKMEGSEFKAHKTILAAQSPYFEAMLFGSFRESSENEIELKEISATTFEVVLKYMYTGRMLFDSSSNTEKVRSQKNTQNILLVQVSLFTQKS